MNEINEKALNSQFFFFFFPLLSCFSLFRLEAKRVQSCSVSIKSAKRITNLTIKKKKSTPKVGIVEPRCG